jgi:chromosome segregation ATPase
VRLLRDAAQHAGRAVELEDEEPREIAGMVEGAPEIECPEPTPPHEYAGCITPDADPPLRAALAAAARSCGERVPADDEVATLEEKAAGISVETVDLAAARERVARTGTAETELRERVARLGGKVEAKRESGDGEEAAAELRAAATELTEAETEHLAARQALESARERAREQRDARERKRRLADRADNLRRRARERLARKVYPRFRAALGSLPGAEPSAAGSVPDEYAGEGTSAALAVARLADLHAPVVVACGRFDSAREAAKALDAPVIRVQNSA